MNAVLLLLAQRGKKRPSKARRGKLHGRLAEGKESNETKSERRARPDISGGRRKARVSWKLEHENRVIRAAGRGRERPATKVQTRRPFPLPFRGPCRHNSTHDKCRFRALSIFLPRPRPTEPAVKPSARADTSRRACRGAGRSSPQLSARHAGPARASIMLGVDLRNLYHRAAVNSPPNRYTW